MVHSAGNTPMISLSPEEEGGGEGEHGLSPLTLILPRRNVVAA